MDFKNEFHNWANRNLEAANSHAYCFNLIENSDVYSIELVGTNSFDSQDEDWACDECFEATPRSIEIGNEFDNWESCLWSMVDFLEGYIGSNEIGANILNKSKGVGVGFVDGNLEILKKT